MPIQVSPDDNGKVLIVHVTGTVVKAEYELFVPEIESYLREHGKARLLLDMTGLHGWDAGAMWEDLKFDIKHHADIGRLAMVGDKQWHHILAVIFKPFTKAETRYFDQTEIDHAKTWLSAN